MIYFTSDLHFGHKAIISMQKRPFKSVEEMNQVLLDNYNSLVGKDDYVYILGDICHRMRLDEANDIISRMNGKKILLIGNHDKRYDPKLFVEMKDFMILTFCGTTFVLMHYPLLSWPKKKSGSIQLHGHIHASAGYNLSNRAEGIRRYDVGVDANDYFPVSLDKITDFFGVKMINS